MIPKLPGRQEHPEHPLIFTDTSLLRDPEFLARLAEVPVGTTLFSEEKAEATALEIMELVEGLVAADDRIIEFLPHYAWKSNRFPPVGRAILKARSRNPRFENVRWRADTATVEESKEALWAGRSTSLRAKILHALHLEERADLRRWAQDLIYPEDIGFSNLWVDEEEIYELVQMGVTDFVVDQENVIGWIAAAGRKYKKDLKTLHVTLRVYVGGSQGQKFGMHISKLEPMASYARDLGLDVAGVAFHAGTLNSFEYQFPAEHGMDLPEPTEDMFFTWSNAVRTISPTLNDLYVKGLIGNLINTEGGIRPAYGAAAWDWKALLTDLVKALKENIAYQFRWKIEPGRLFGVCAVAKTSVTNVDLTGRGGDIPYCCLKTSSYSGNHDAHWEAPLVLRLSDVLAGRIYTWQDNPEEFGLYRPVGWACAGSDVQGARTNRRWVPMPKDLQPGEVVVILPAGSYLSAAFSPQANQMMEGRFVAPEAAFNGIRWQRDMTVNKKKFPVAPVRRWYWFK